MANGKRMDHISLKLSVPLASACTASDQIYHERRKQRQMYVSVIHFRNKDRYNSVSDCAQHAPCM